MNWSSWIISWFRPKKPVVAPVPTPAPSPISWSPAELVALLNAERAKFGQPPLVLDTRLTGLAQKWADFNALNDKLDHGDFIGRVASQYSMSAKDIAAGQLTAQQVADDWMNSPPHRSNILGVAYRKIGIGRAMSKTSMLYWVADFAS